MDQPKTIAAITTDQMLRAGLSRLSVLRMAALSPKGARVHRTIYDMEIQDLKEKVLILSFTLHANSYNLPSFQLSALIYELSATKLSGKIGYVVYRLIAFDNLMSILY